jgi:uncharacterized membrane protein
VTTWVYLVGRMLGFGTAGGVRPALTLAIIGVMDRLDIGPQVKPPFHFLDHWITIVVLLGLALVEANFDNVPMLARLQDRLLMPWRVTAGAVAATATIGHGATGLIAGLVIGAAVAWLGQTVKHGARPRQSHGDLAFSLVSLSEDLFAFIGAIATGLFGLLGYAFFGINVWLYVWLRRRRRRKYRVRRVQRNGSS